MEDLSEGITMASNEYSDLDRAANLHTFQYNPDETRELGTAVTTAVASVTGTPVTQVGESLADSVDTDGLDRLFRPTLASPGGRGGVLEITVDGCAVRISSNGRIVVET